MRVSAAVDRLNAVITRRRRWIVGAWAVLFVLAVPLSLKQTDHLTQGGFEAPGYGSAEVERQLVHFDRAAGGQAGVVLVTRGRDGAAAQRRGIRRVRAAAGDVRGVRVQPVRRVDRARGVVIVPLTLEGRFDERIDIAADLRDTVAARGVDDGGLDAYVVGQDALWAALHDLQKEDLAEAEVIGFPITLLILLAAFGSLAAASLPLILGALSVTLTGAAIYFLSRITDMSVFVTNAASMIGIGVAVDYSFFVLARYRQEIARGIASDEARRNMLHTSGLAVVFSGITVMVCLVGTFLVDSTVMRSMALGVIVVVAISILGAITLLPAGIALIGRRLAKPGRSAAWAAATGHALRRLKPRSPDRPGDFWERWSRAVMRRPVASVVAASALMLALAIPALDLDMGESASAQFPADHEARRGTELAGELLGPGRLAPIRVMATFRRGDVGDTPNRRAVAAQRAALERRRDVAAVDPPEPSRDGRRVLLTVVPRESPEATATQELLADLRAEADARGGLARVADVQVGGVTAENEDFVDLISGSMWKITLFIAIVGFLVLMVMLRSLLLPIKAVFMTLLSVASAYGVLVAVFQWGWFDGLLGYDSPGYIEAIVPPMLLTVVFGLSMDYEVFLLSRIREYVRGGGDDRDAVARGLRVSAGTITSAALIMVSVFAVFAGVGVPGIKEIGVGLAVAVALDATIVRLILVPATMQLLGRWNWWFPSVLDRVVPRVAFDFEERSSPAAARSGTTDPDVSAQPSG